MILLFLIAVPKQLLDDVAQFVTGVCMKKHHSKTRRNWLTTLKAYLSPETVKLLIKIVVFILDLHHHDK